MSNQRYSVVNYTLLVLLVCPVRAGDQGQTVYITQAKGSPALHIEQAPAKTSTAAVPDSARLNRFTTSILQFLMNK
jgi:hypothetical protein